MSAVGQSHTQQVRHPIKGWMVGGFNLSHVEHFNHSFFVFFVFSSRRKTLLFLGLCKLSWNFMIKKARGVFGSFGELKAFQRIPGPGNDHISPLASSWVPPLQLDRPIAEKNRLLWYIFWTDRPYCCWVMLQYVFIYQHPPMGGV